MKTTANVVTLVAVLVLAVAASGEENQGWIATMFNSMFGTTDTAQAQVSSRSVGIAHGHVDMNNKGVAIVSHGFPIVTMCPLNVIFILDGSDSVSLHGFGLAKSYLIHSIKRVTSMYSEADVGVIMFSNGVSQEIELRPRNLLQLEQLYEEIDALIQPRYETFLHEAITRASFNLTNYRPREGKVVILISDGCPNNVSASAAAAVNAWDSGVYIMSVAIEKAQVAMLKQISARVLDITTDVDWQYTVACPPSTIPQYPNGLTCSDIVIVMDGSDSAGKHESVIKQYLANLVLRFTNVPNQLGLVVYGTNVEYQYSFPLTSDKQGLSTRILDNIVFPSSGTGTDKGILHAISLLQVSGNPQKTIIVITDGPPINIDATQQATSQAMAAGIKVVIVGVGGHVKYSNLVKQAGGIQQNVKVQFSFLDLYKIEFKDDVCGVSCTVSCYNGRIVPVGSSGCRCQCEPGFTGDDCSIASRNCQICENGGQPSNINSPTDCSCICPPGYSGLYCERNMCEAISIRCRGTIKRTANGCSCECGVGMTGQFCDSPLCDNSNCDSSNGQFHGQPEYDILTRQCGCRCNAQYTGFRCADINCNFQSSCQNGATSYRAGTKCYCRCSAAWTGDRCERRVDACPSCGFNGRRTNPGTPSDCRCTCNFGYSGPRCEVDACTSLPCQMGTKLKVLGGCRCQCNSGVTGVDCSVCRNSCLNGGISINLNGQCTCRCINGYLGDQCERPPSCSNVNCNGGTANFVGDGCRCLCPPGMTGNFCQAPLCTDAVICNNQGRAFFNTATNKCACQCNQNYLAPFCNVRACNSATITCRNGGTPQLFGTVCRCNCPAGFSGTQCETDVCRSFSCMAGTKIPTTGGCRCQCFPNVIGTSCNQCSLSFSCQNGGRAQTTATGCSCACVNGFTGNQCQIQPRCLTDQNTCSGNGQARLARAGNGCECTCNPGFTGTNCNTRLCVNNGRCNNNGVEFLNTATNVCECRCNPGYLLPSCAVRDCNFQSPCQNGATSYRAGTKCYCRCSAAWTGDRCERRVDTCSSCGFNGKRTSPGNPLDCRCTCNSGYTGPKCDVDTCISLPCEMGTKQPILGACRCNCNSGVTGVACNVCDNNNCLNGGQSVKLFGGCSCRCINGYRGPQCERPPACLNFNCNGGTVNAVNDICRCLCPPGMTGDRCQDPLCTNARNCNSQGTAFFNITANRCECQCNQNYLQPSCNIRDCSNVNCNTGRAEARGSQCVCICPPNRTGTFCTTPVCNSATITCQNRGTPQLFNNVCRCNCPAGFSGTRCETDVCRSIPCMAGTKIPTTGGCRCQCFANVFGTSCNQCSPSFNCQNGGTARTTTTGCSCVCANGYSGNQCQIQRRCLTDQNTCSGNGIARLARVGNGCECTCNPGFTGTNCNTRLCTDGGTCNNQGTAFFNTATNKCECRCNQNYLAPFCNVRACNSATITCRNAGTPQLFGTVCRCNCPAGFSGLQCETDVCRSLPCTAGTKIPTTGGCRCQCFPNVIGTSCNQCSPSFNCQNGGNAQTTTNGCRCVCVNGYSGNQCQIPPPCLTNPNTCSGNGQARLSTTGFGCTCTCNPGFTGTNCNNRLCTDSGTCNNQGTAFFNSATNKCECRCNQNYLAPFCNVRACNSATITCRNGGTPQLFGTVCRCNCPAGFSGAQCQTDVCRSLPCSAGTKIPTTGGCRCQCFANVIGTSCNQCSTTFNCQNGGLAQTTATGCSCVCVNGYSGNQCQIQPRCLTDQNTCSGNGIARLARVGNGCECTCNPGFTGTNCNTRLCTDGGTCNNQGTAFFNTATNKCECRCNQNYLAPFCNVRACNSATITCQNGGTPQLFGTVCRCNCPAGFSGAQCQTDVCGPLPCLAGTRIPTTGGCRCECYSDTIGTSCNQCSSSFICQNGGTVRILPSGCRCYCANGYSGAQCQIPICTQARMLCQNGGQPQVNGPTCVCNCLNGFSGVRCERALCQNFCRNGGTPFSGASGCSCNCPNGYSGATCELRQCDTFCVNGVATGPFPNCNCRCNPNYIGERCDQLDPCLSVQCLNGGRKQQVGTTCQCVCAQGFTGNNCASSLCSSARDCNNQGTAVFNVGLGRCQCFCNSGFTGTQCENPDCSSGTITCQNGGTPQLFGTSCRCNCVSGYTGLRCEIDPCSRTSCLNGGQKIRTGSICTCNCPPGYSGPSCATQTCSRVRDCLDRGDAIWNPSIGQCQCFCNVGFSGPRCETIVSCRSDCLNGGRANIAGPGACVCDCPPSYTGTVCETLIETSSCTGAENLCQNGQPSIYNSCTGRCQCVCNEQYAGVYCEIPVGVTECDKCYWQNGVGYTYAKNRCDMYVTCQKLETGFRRIGRMCGPGTFWDNEKLTCGAIGTVQNCIEDPCIRLPPNSNYSNPSSCQEYYTCGFNMTASKQCCEDGFGFSRQLQRCVPNPNCVGTCRTKSRASTTPSCFRKCEMIALPPDNKSFRRKIGDQSILNCGPKTFFNETICGCDHDRRPEPKADVCLPDRDLHFNTFQAQYFIYDNVTIGNNAPGLAVNGNVQNMAGKFDGNDRVLIPRFANSGFHFNYFIIKMRIRPGSLLPNVPYAVISNGDCGHPESVAIILINQQVRFTCQPIDSPVTSITVNYQVDAQGWLNLELNYNKNTAGGYSFFGVVGTIKTEVQTLSAPIDDRKCALQVGQGFQYTKFVGYVDWVQIYTTCDPDAFVVG